MATNIADGIWWFDLGTVNAYLVDDGAVTLVDAGTPGRADDLRDGLDEAGYDPGAVDRVLITHFDVDHVGGLASLGLDAPIHAMEPDASQLDGSLSAPLTNKKGLFQRLAGFVLTLPDAPVRRLDDGERTGGFRAYHTPGHTPVATCLQQRRERTEYPRTGRPGPPVRDRVHGSRRSAEQRREPGTRGPGSSSVARAVRKADVSS